MKFDFSKLLEISARTAFAVACACLLLLFFPADALPFDISVMRSQYGIWLFAVLVLAVSIILSYFLKWLCSIIKSKYDVYRTWSGYKAIFECLSNDEKCFLKSKYDNNENTLMIDLTSPMHKHLQTLKILSLNVGTNLGRPSGMPGFIQPWVFDLIRKYPDMVEITTHNSDEESASLINKIKNVIYSGFYSILSFIASIVYLIVDYFVSDDFYCALFSFIILIISYVVCAIVTRKLRTIANRNDVRSEMTKRKIDKFAQCVGYLSYPLLAITLVVGIIK